MMKQNSGVNLANCSFRLGQWKNNGNLGPEWCEIILFFCRTHEQHNSAISNNRHRSSKNGKLSSSIDGNHGQVAEGKQKFGHNPIRPQSTGINNGKWKEQRKRPEIDKIVGIGKAGGYNTGNNRELPVNYELEQVQSHKRWHRPSSAEMASLKGQTASIFSPVPSRRTNGQIIRPIQPINAATTGNGAYLKRIHSVGGHLAPGVEEFLEEQQQQELLDRRLILTFFVLNYDSIAL